MSIASATSFASAPIVPANGSYRLLTVADIATLPSELPSGPVLYELDNGRLITMAPPGEIHGAIEGNFATALKISGQKRGFGKMRSGEVGVVLWRNPDRVVGADTVFVANASLPIRRSPEGYLETIPELIVEVKSKNDTWPEVLRKVADYHRAGVHVVWVADYETLSVLEYRPGVEPKTYSGEEVLTIEDVIPGFQMSLAEVFEL